MKKIINYRIVVLLTATMLQSTFAETAYEMKALSVKPQLLSGKGKVSAGLAWNIQESAHIWEQASSTDFYKSLEARAGTEGMWAGDDTLNTQPIKADVALSGVLNLYRPALISRGAHVGEYVTNSPGFNLGRFDISTISSYETDQSFDNANFTVGGEVAYVLTESHGAKALIPSVYLGYDWVNVDKSKLQETLGLKDDNSQRFRAFASWKIPIPGVPSLAMHADARYYRSQGLPNALQDEATYVAGALSYGFGDKPLLGYVNNVYIRVADGRIPPNPDDETIVTIGFTMFDKQGSKSGPSP